MREWAGTKAPIDSHASLICLNISIVLIDDCVVIDVSLSVYYFCCVIPDFRPPCSDKI